LTSKRLILTMSGIAETLRKAAFRDNANIRIRPWEGLTCELYGPKRR